MYGLLSNVCVSLRVYAYSCIHRLTRGKKSRIQIDEAHAFTLAISTHLQCEAHGLRMYWLRCVQQLIDCTAIYPLFCSCWRILMQCNVFTSIFFSLYRLTEKQKQTLCKAQEIRLPNCQNGLCLFLSTQFSLPWHSNDWWEENYDCGTTFIISNWFVFRDDGGWSGGEFESSVIQLKQVIQTRSVWMDAQEVHLSY